MAGVNGFLGKHLGGFLTAVALMSIAGLIAWGAQQNQISNLPSPEEHGRMAQKVEQLEEEHNPQAFGRIQTSMATLIQALGITSSDVQELQTNILQVTGTLIELETNYKNLKEDVKALERKHN